MFPRAFELRSRSQPLDWGRPPVGLRSGCMKDHTTLELRLFTMKIKIVSCGRWWKYLPQDWEAQPAPSAAEAGPPAGPLPLLRVTRTCKIQPRLPQRTSRHGPCYLCGEGEGMCWWVVAFPPPGCLHGGCAWDKVKGVSPGSHVWAGPGHGGRLMSRRVPCPRGTSVVKPMPMNETQHHELPQELWLGRRCLSLNGGSPRSSRAEEFWK